tara:strand:- start:30 stop:599 length:570 start_codon:yes stop_codon:yes gene_type:complete
MEKIKMNKTLSTILIVWMLLSIIENVLNLKRMKLYEQRQEELDSRDEQLSKRLKVYEKLSDPKTVQFYVSELNKIVDNMHRLGKIIDEGGEIDLDIARIEKQYMIFEEKFNSIDNSINGMKYLAHDVDALYDITSVNEENIKSVADETLSEINEKMKKQIDLILKDIENIKNTLNKIENSKIGKKIWNQ